MTPELYSLSVKLAYTAILIPTLLVIITAVMSAKEMGGRLGQGLKKIAAGTIIHAVLFVLYLWLERGNRGLLKEADTQVFLTAAGLLASLLLAFGYLQIYKITKRLKLFAT